MATSHRKVKEDEKAALKREAEYYSNLISNYEKLQQTGKTLSSINDPKLNVLSVKPHQNSISTVSRTGNCSKSLNESHSLKSVTNINMSKKSFVSNAYVYKRTIVQNKCKSSFPPSTSLYLNRLVNEPKMTGVKRDLPFSSVYKKVNTINKRTVLYNTRNNSPTLNFSNRSIVPNKVTLKDSNKMPLDESNDLRKASSNSNEISIKTTAMTKQMEQKNVSLPSSTGKKILSVCSIESSNMLNNTSSKLCAGKSSFTSFKKKNFFCKDVIPKSELKNQMCTISSPLTLEGSKNVVENKLEKSLKDKIFDLLDLHPLKDEKLDQSLTRSNLIPLPLSKRKLNDEHLTESKLSVFLTKQGSKIIKKKSPKCLQPNLVSLTPVKRVTFLQKPLSSSKKKGDITRVIATKYKVINKKNSRSSTIAPESCSPKVEVKKTPNIRNSRTKWSLNAHAVHKAPIVKALNSKYKIVNHIKSPVKKLNSTKFSSPKTVKNQVLRKKHLDSYMYVNTPKYANCQGINKRILSKSFVHNPTIQPKLHFKHTKLNYAFGSNLKRSTKANLNRNSHSLAVNSKYKIVNKPGSSKKNARSLRLKSDTLCSKSGADMDLILELAAEKKSSEDENCVLALPKKSILYKRVYKSKNTIINKNVFSTGAKMAKTIKMKYLLNRRNVWHRQAISRKFTNVKHYKGHQFRGSFQRTSTSPFHNLKVRRNYFKSPIQNRARMTKFSRHYKGSAQFNKTYKRIVTYRNDYLKSFPSQAKSSTPISKVLASRVLHRSINRVLTASVKKKLSKVNTYCMFYNRFGRCNKGLKCSYIHDPSKIAVCTRFLRGTCKIESCPFSHEISPGKMAICSFYLQGVCTKTDCPYRHETLSPDAELCKAFVQGYCPDGKQCTKAHVLVCPQYIQGFCEKGNACAFPHPPPKDKKNLPKPAEKCETPKETEELLMDRVSRYFLNSNEQIGTSEIGETSVVPRRRRLSEQPSFIAL